MAHVATPWEIWYAGLVDGPEPWGRRFAATIVADRAEADRNFALACFQTRRNWEQQHPPQPNTPDPVWAHHDRMQRFEMD